MGCVFHVPCIINIVDIFLPLILGSTSDMEVKLLEVNWGPDCKRACEYYPEFFNDIFSTLFLEDNKNVVEL